MHTCRHINTYIHMYEYMHACNILNNMSMNAQSSIFISGMGWGGSHIDLIIFFNP